MKKFEIGETNFLLNDKPFKILSGAIHYFRLVPDMWYHSLYNLKAMGCNTVETYVAWNIHEPQEGEFYFEENANLIKFIEVAQSLGLYVILRPTPYICAEWEYGGLPAWLLNYKNLRVRSNTPLFLEKVDNYFKVLLNKVKHLQITYGGPILMMQIENEYGSFGNDKNYLREMKKLMEKYGINVPLFTSDGAWQEALYAGSLIEDGIMPTGNFGSRSNENLDELEKFINDNNKKYPLMCMEFWDGWFNRWKEPIIKRDAQDLADCTDELLKRASINFYMFHGGTNFGFMNGCSARLHTDLPQVTSYDYDAPLTEWGDPTEKFYKLQKVLVKYSDANEIKEPLIIEKKAYDKLKVKDSVSLSSVLDLISSEVVNDYTLTMEELKHYYGYVLYRANIKGRNEERKVRIIDGRDRIKVYQDNVYITTQYQHEIGEDIMLSLEDKEHKIDFLAENMGRVNYGGRLMASTQNKGIKSGVIFDLHFHTKWSHYPLDFTKISNIDYTREFDYKQPSFYKFEITLDKLCDTFIDCSNYGKGIILVNGFNLGRYWAVGPIAYLYLPKSLLKEGYNEIVVFETEGVEIKELVFSKEPVYITEDKNV